MVGPSIAFCRLFRIYDSVNKIFIAKFVWNVDLLTWQGHTWSFITGVVAAHKGLSDVIIIKEVRKQKVT